MGCQVLVGGGGSVGRGRGGVIDQFLAQNCQAAAAGASPFLYKFGGRSARATHAVAAEVSPLSAFPETC